MVRRAGHWRRMDLLQSAILAGFLGTLQACAQMRGTDGPLAPLRSRQPRPEAFFAGAFLIGSGQRPSWLPHGEP